MTQKSDLSQQNTEYSRGNSMTNNYVFNPQYYASPHMYSMVRPWGIMSPQFIYDGEIGRRHDAFYYSEESADKSGGESKIVNGRKRTMWTTEQAKFLLQLWASNHDYINSEDSKKAWKKISEKFDKRFKTRQIKLDQMKRKIKYHVEKYKEIREWNKNQSDANQRECDFFDIIDGILGKRDLLQFTDVTGVGEECIKKEVDTDEEDSLAIPGPSSSRSVQASHQDVTDMSSQEDTDNDSEVPRSGHIQEGVEKQMGKEAMNKPKEKIGTQNEKMMAPNEKMMAPNERMNTSIEQMMASRMNTPEDQGTAKMEDFLEKVSKQWDALVVVMQRMEESVRIQTNAMLEISRNLSLYLARQGSERKSSTIRRSRSPRRKRAHRREDSDDSDIF